MSPNSRWGVNEMTSKMFYKGPRFTTAMAAVLALGLTTTAVPAPAQQGVAAQTPSQTINVSAGQGTLVRLSSPMSDLFVADSEVADVQVRSTTQLYIFGKKAGETTIYATDKSGRVVYSTNVRVGNNITGVDNMLRLAMPDANIVATPLNGLILLTGTVGQPADAAEAVRLVKAMVGDKVEIVSRLTTATPLQVMLSVRIAEVNRDFAKDIGINLLSSDTTGGFLFGIGQGRSPGTITANPDGSTSYTFTPKGAGTTTIGAAGRLLGLDILGALDLAETDGAVTTLANPTLTALSGETASFLAGGEIPIPISQALGTVSVEYKQYGVSLAFTPTVLSDGRISMRVRPEVSQLSSAGAVELNGFSIPGITTRRIETSVELGSGQSFVIGGLLSSNDNNSVSKAPFLGDIPILGALFRSTKFRRQQTELMVVVTPYLVKPVNGRVALPTDGYAAPNDFERNFTNRMYGDTGQPAPQPRDNGDGNAVQPGMSGAGGRSGGKSKEKGSARPGFGN